MFRFFSFFRVSVFELLKAILDDGVAEVVAAGVRAAGIGRRRIRCPDPERGFLDISQLVFDEVAKLLNLANLGVQVGVTSTVAS